MSRIIQNKTNLEKYLATKGLDRQSFASELEDKFSFLAPTSYLDTIDWQNPDDPLKKMVWPDAQELDIKAYQITDPIGDEPHLAVPNLVHRYPNRVLLLLTNKCQINCRFCFRRELTHHAQPADLKQIHHYLSQHPEVNEVIFSGGDPLILSAKYLTEVYNQLKTLTQLKIFRFHTRIPVVNPAWIDERYINFFRQLAQERELVIVLHINHAQELTDQVNSTIQQLKKLGAMLLSQTVLLKAVNDQPQILAELFSRLCEVGVKPYYLHHPDLVKGTHHFRLSIKEGLKIFQTVRSLVSGIALPAYVLDLPGGKGKVSVENLREIRPKTYQARNFKGELVIYRDPA